MKTDLLDLPEGLYDAAETAGHGGVFSAVMPIIVSRSSDGRFTVVDGCKRLAALRASDTAECSCGVLAPSPDRAALGFLRISLNRGRPRSLAETLCFVRWIRVHVGEERLAAEARQLGIGDADVREAVGLLRCSAFLQEAAISGVMHPQAADLFCVWQDCDAAELFRALGDLRPSLQMQREFAEWLPEICCRDATTVADVLAAPAVRGILGSASLNGPQKLAALRRELHTVRFPMLAAAHRRWEELAARVNPDRSTVTLTPSSGFEKNRLEVRIVVTDAGAAVQTFSRLAAVAEEQWRSLIHPLQGERAGHVFFRSIPPRPTGVFGEERS